MPLISPPRLMRVYARNIDLLAYKRGWSTELLAKRLALSPNTLIRIRRHQSKYIDPEVLLALMDVFDCTPNDILLPQEGVNYDEETS
jgi:DNA-binding Xre family transcriptional regulator